MIIMKDLIVLFDCYEAMDGVSLLRQQPDIQCYAAEWNALLPWALIGLITYGIG
jgi:hypothetical protein